MIIKYVHGMHLKAPSNSNPMQRVAGLPMTGLLFNTLTMVDQFDLCVPGTLCPQGNLASTGGLQ